MDNHHSRLSLTGDEWAERLGQSVRELRQRKNVTQSELARRANIDRTTVARIERGDGGSVRSLVQIARALDREDWLASFAPPAPEVSPMELLRARRRDEAHERRRARPSSAPTATSAP